MAFGYDEADTGQTALNSRNAHGRSLKVRWKFTLANGTVYYRLALTRPTRHPAQLGTLLTAR